MSKDIYDSDKELVKVIDVAMEAYNAQGLDPGTASGLYRHAQAAKGVADDTLRDFVVLEICSVCHGDEAVTAEEMAKLAVNALEAATADLQAVVNGIREKFGV